MMHRRLLLVACLVGLSVFGVGTPATADVMTPGQLSSTGTWVGQVVRHEAHLDYVGRPCPVEVDVCATFVARYMIVPTTAQAFFALQSAAGGRARLRGSLLPATFGPHQGFLFVSAVL